MKSSRCGRRNSHHLAIIKNEKICFELWHSQECELLRQCCTSLWHNISFQFARLHNNSCTIDFSYIYYFSVNWMFENLISRKQEMEIEEFLEVKHHFKERKIHFSRSQSNTFFPLAFLYFLLSFPFSTVWFFLFLFFCCLSCCCDTFIIEMIVVNLCVLSHSMRSHVTISKYFLQRQDVFFLFTTKLFIFTQMHPFVSCINY